MFAFLSLTKLALSLGKKKWSVIALLVFVNETKKG
jgi:hypothetical protein